MKDIKIADELINNLLQVSYLGLNTRLKKVRLAVGVVMVWACAEGQDLEMHKYRPS